MMMHDTHRDGRLVERADDESRTVTTYDAAGKVTSTRPYTAEENAQADAAIASRATLAVQQQLTADTTADLARIEAAISDLLGLLADDTTPGSLRALIGPARAAAGTGSLRALRQQSNTAVVNAASIKAFLGLAVDLAQLVITATGANRRIARQTLRLAREMVGDHSSADVGIE